MPGADLRLAKQKRRVVPPAVESVGDRVGDAGHLGFVPAESVDHGRRVREQFGPVELEMIGGEREVRAVLLQDMHEPMGKLEVAVSGALGLPEPLQERLVADAVQLAGDRFDADVRAHGRIPYIALSSRLTTWNRASRRNVSSLFAQLGDIQLVHPTCASRPSLTGVICPAGIASSMSQSYSRPR